MYRDQNMNLKINPKTKNRILEKCMCVCSRANFTTTSNFNKLNLTQGLGDYKVFKWASSYDLTQLDF